MALTISAYKNNTVASISGTTFNSNGTPFVAGDVGRCIVITSGVAEGQIRKITGFTDTNTVTMEFAWDISPYVNFINAVSSLPFVEVNPVASDAWTMSSYLDDVDDTTNINKALGEDVYEFVGTNVITISGFLYDISKVIYLDTRYVSINPTGYMRLGDIDVNGNVFNGCALNEIGNDWTPLRNWTSSANGDAGNLHLYDCLVNITTITGAADGIFWSLYNSADSQYRFDGCSFNGNFGVRFRGDKSVIKDCQWYGGDSQLTVPDEIDWETVGPYGTVGLITGVKFLNKDTVIYWNKVFFGWQIENLSIENIVNALVYVTGSDTDPGTIIGFDADQIEALPVVVEINTASSGSFFLRNPITTSVVDASLVTITDSYKRVIWDSANVTADDTTVTDGDWDRFDALWWTIDLNQAVGDYDLTDGTTTTPYNQAIISYNYLPNTLVQPLRKVSEVQFTALPDNSITQTTKTTVDAYTTIVNGEQFYDRSKSWTFDNFDDQFPTQGGLLVDAIGTLLDLKAASLVIDGAAVSAFAVVQTGNGTITIDGGTTFAVGANGFNTIKTTGSVTVEDTTIINGWTIDGDLILNDELDLTNVTVTGDININTALNSTLNFSNVQVTGSIFNDATGNTLTINSTNGSTLTAGDAGIANGETNIVQTVNIKVIVKDIESSDLIENARVFIEADIGGDLPSSESVTITRSSSTATVTHTAHGMVNGETIIIRNANEQEYNGAYVLTLIDVNSYSYTLIGTPATPATGTIISTAQIINELTNASGEVNKVQRYTNDQPVKGVARKATL